MDAIRRIERAMARAEAAAARPAAPVPPPEDHDQLRAAHDMLRQRVAGAIGRLDELIESERGG